MRKVSQFTGFHSYVGKTFVDLASSVLKVLKKTHCSYDSLGNLSRFIENQQKPQNYSLAQLLSFTAYEGTSVL